jgi:hypothetical protein
MHAAIALLGPSEYRGGAGKKEDRFILREFLSLLVLSPLSLSFPKENVTFEPPKAPNNGSFCIEKILAYLSKNMEEH